MPIRLNYVLIAFGEITVKTSYPFFVSLLYVIRNYLYYHIKNIGDQNNIWKKNPIFFTLILFFGEFINMLLCLISNYLIKSPGITTKIKYYPVHKHSKYYYVSSITKKKIAIWKLYLFLYLSSLSYSISFTTVNCLTSSKYDQSLDLSFEIRIFILFFIVILSYFILKYPIYRHQKFSIVLVLLGITLTSIFKFTNDKTTSNYAISIPTYLAVYFLFSCREVFQKWLMEYQNQTPIKIVVSESIFGIVNLLIVLFSVQNSYGFNNVTELFYQMFKLNVVGYFIGYLLLSFLYAFFAIFTKYYYSPTVMSVAYSLSIMLWNIIILVEIQSNNDWYYQYLPGYLLLFLGCLLYNEIIILYFCGLDEYTKKEITYRSLRDIRILNNNLIAENEIINNDNN